VSGRQLGIPIEKRERAEYDGIAPLGLATAWGSGGRSAPRGSYLTRKADRSVADNVQQKEDAKGKTIKLKNVRARIMSYDRDRRREILKVFLAAFAFIGTATLL
jgi:hypothetical protein